MDVSAGPVLPPIPPLLEGDILLGANQRRVELPNTQPTTASVTVVVEKTVSLKDFCMKIKSAVGDIEWAKMDMCVAVDCA